MLLLWLEQRGRCAYTHAPLKLGVNASIDHVVPQCDNGDRNVDNLKWVHIDVNMAKQKKSLVDFLALCRDVLSGFGYRIEKGTDDYQVEKDG